MKAKKLLALVLLVTHTLLYMSCDDTLETPGNGNTILPERFSIDIPGSLSNTNALSNGRKAEDGFSGNEIYENLNLFIHVGEGSSEIIEGIILSIARYQINRPLVMSFESDEDGRTKNLVVSENQTYEGTPYEFELTITDAESESNNDGGKAIQVFWNRHPIKGVAILKPYNINRDKEALAGDAIYRVDYDETGTADYDATMTVSIANLPMAGPLVDQFAINSLKMFVGKKGDIIDVYGNSNHPNARLFPDNPQQGFNWAFVASGSKTTNLGVAEVGLPPSNLDEVSANVLLKDYSIKNVFEDLIFSLWPSISQELVDAYLHNTEAPGYFNEGGFVQGGTSPGSEYDVIASRINELSPFNPKSVSTLSIEFK